MNSPDVLLVCQQVRGTRSGVGTYVRSLLGELCRRGMRPRVATWGTEIDATSFPEAEWIDLGAPAARDPTPGAFHTLGRRAAEALGRSAPPAGVVHFTDAREAHACVGPGRLRGAALVGTVHDDYAATAPRSPLGLIGRAADPLRRWAYYAWLRRLERRCYRTLDLVMVNSDATGCSISQAYGVAPEVLRTVHLCAPAPQSAPAPADLPGDPALLFAGGNFHRKGLDTLVRSLPPLRSSCPGVHLHVAGEDPARRRIERIARDAGVADAVTFHGRVPRERIAALMAAADAFVMPSRTEALGLVYLEAFHAGLPVIAGNVGGVTEIVRDAISGLTVPPEDPRTLAGAIERLHRDPDLRTRLVEGGHAVLAERTPARLADETLAAYREALGGPGADPSSGPFSG